MFRFCLFLEGRNKIKLISESFEEVIFSFMLEEFVRNENFDSVTSCFRKYGMLYVRDVYFLGIGVIFFLVGKVGYLRFFVVFKFYVFIILLYYIERY